MNKKIIGTRATSLASNQHGVDELTSRAGYTATAFLALEECITITRHGMKG